MKKAIAIATALAVAGCTGPMPKRTVDSSAAATFAVKRANPLGRAVQDVADENQKNLEEGLEKVLNYCLPRLSGYEEKSAQQAEWAFWLAMSGLLAGAVAVPALTAAAAKANAGWIASLSGWSGSTNFAGQVLRTSGLSGSTIAETRNNIIKNVRAQLAISMDGEKTFEERRTALLDARSYCAIYEIAVPSVPDAPQKP